MIDNSLSVGRLAQLVARALSMRKVPGSIPGLSIFGKKLQVATPIGDLPFWVYIPVFF